MECDEEGGWENADVIARTEGLQSAASAVTGSPPQLAVTPCRNVKSNGRCIPLLLLL